MLLHGRNRHDPRMGVMQMKARLLRLHRPRLHQNDAGNDLQAIGDAMLHFLEHTPSAVGVLPFRAPRRAAP